VLPIVALAAAASAPAASAPVAAAGPVWSPDSRRVAFVGVVDPGKRTDIFVAPVAGGAATDVTASAADGFRGQPTWSRSGRTIGYETNESNPQETKVRVSLVGADGTGARDLALAGAVGNLCFTARDRTLVFDDFESVSTIRADGTGRKTIAGGAGSPVCSPDGLRVAFDARTGANNDDVVVADTNGAHRRRITRARGGDRPLAWSRNGGQILFSSQRALYVNQNAGVGLFLTTPTGKRQHRVASGLPGDLFSASGDLTPDGKRVVYVSRSGALVIAGADGRHARQLARAAQEPRWSPDGRWIAYASGGQVAIVHPDGSGRRFLAP